MKRVVGLGACAFDTLINCDKFPTEDTKQRADGIFVSGGGPVGNALVVMSKLGLKTEVIGSFGGDEAGKYLLAEFEQYGVSTKNTVVLKDKTSFTSYVILSADKATRTCVFNRGTVPDSPDLLNLSAIEGAFALHLDGNYLDCAIEAAKYAKEKGVKVSLDAGGLYSGIERLLPYVDVLIPSKEFALGFTGKSDVKFAMLDLYARFLPETLVVTDGADGGYYYENGEILHYDSVKVKAVDTNGAGDTFHGAFLVAYSKAKTVKECCEFAGAVAAFKCMNKGVRTVDYSKRFGV